METSEKFPAQPEDFSFHNTLFFIMTSVSIIGYGSTVTTFFGRVFLIFLLAFVFIAIPNQSTKIVTLLGAESTYARRSYKSIDNVDHIVLIG